mgnify:CR=1 FL=1
MHVYCVYRTETENESDALISDDESVADTIIEELVPATHDAADGEETETDSDGEGPFSTAQEEAEVAPMASTTGGSGSSSTGGSGSSSTPRRRRRSSTGYSNLEFLGASTRSRAKRTKSLRDHLSPPTSCKRAVTRLQDHNPDPYG